MSSGRRKEIPSIPVFSSDTASNSDVAAPFMVDKIYKASVSNPEDLLIELETVYLLGQSQREIFNDTVECVVACQHLPALENLFKVDVNKVRHLTEKDVDVNNIGPSVISRAVQGERSDVAILGLFLDLGLDVNKTFGPQGDALMWAVRIGRWELIERILELKGSFDVDEVKYQKYDRAFTLLSVASDRIRIADELHHYGGHDTEEIPIWIDQKRVILELLNRGASIQGTCLLPNLAADLQRKEQSVNFARMLIEEYHADVNEKYEKDTLMHRRWSREAISTPLYEAVRNNFPNMVLLLLEKGADPTAKGHRDMTLVECAWNNKHSGMVELLREKGVPEGPETKGKASATINSLARSTRRTRRTATPARAIRSDSSDDDDMYPEDRRMIMYQAIQP